MPKISVIVPIYGVEEYLRECIDSILAQTFSDIEILLINDGSKDRCPQIIDEYAQKDNRIKAIHKPNGGYGQTCNVGLENAIGEYISIIEPDDFIKPEMYENLYKIAETHNSDIVKSSFYNNIYSFGIHECTKDSFDDKEIPKDRSFTLKECPVFMRSHPSIWSCLFKREFLQKHNLRFIEAPGSGWTDNPFQVSTMCLAERINYTSEAYYYWRIVRGEVGEDLKDWTIPFKRTNEIHDWIEKNNIKDNGILSCLTSRELAYINIVLNKKYDNKEIKKVLEEIAKLVEIFDVNLISNSKYLNEHEKSNIITLKTKGVKYYYNNLRKKRLFDKIKKIRKKIIKMRFGKNEKYISIFGKRWDF